ncbi:MFS transporter [Vibrio nigripulchritudo]|uniref:MFS transporter n=1 Tax=Vibrio nigripulchritudo TaxID=28173 RepID=UPI0003B1B2A5|nr:MFS transporter [Vibrio nigripulchritudo]CCN73615.1 putative Permease of the major facilitator superfamily [Vibrio nigripulchritudo SFn118]
MITVAKHPPFLRLWLGSTSSGFATWGLPFLLGYGMTLEMLSATLLGFALAFRTGGFLVGVLLGGVFADRFSSRQVVLYASLIAFSGILLMALSLPAVEVSDTALLLLGATLSGFGQGACRPAFQALVPRVIESQHLQSANAAMSLSIRIVTLLGPAGVTALAIATGFYSGFALLGICWLLSALLPPWVAQGKSQISVTSYSPKTMLTDMQEALVEVKQHPWFIVSLASLTIVIAAGYSATNVMLPIISKSEFGDSSLLTYSMTAYALGGLLGAVVLGYRNFVPQGWWALVGLAVYGLVPLSLLLGHSIYFPIAAYLLAGIGIEIFNVIWFSSLQKEIPKEKLARVSSIDFLCSYGFAPMGLMLIAPLTEAFGANVVLIGCGILCIAAPLLAMKESSAKHFRVES